jgi:hypothetical protein
MFAVAPGDLGVSGSGDSDSGVSLIKVEDAESDISAILRLLMATRHVVGVVVGRVSSSMKTPTWPARVWRVR